jgi:hypothetical protein
MAAKSMDDIRKIIRDTEDGRGYERERLEKIKQYEHGPQPGPYRPKKANREYTTLIQRSETNLMKLMLRSITDQLFIEDYRRKDDAESAQAWKFWQANKLDSRQGQIFYSAIRDGYAFGTVFPGKSNGENIPEMRGVSARRMYAVYDDPVEDEWPEYALRLNQRWEVAGLIDDTYEYEIYRNPGETTLSVRRQEHGSRVCPVVRYAPHMDLDGRCTGDVQPLYPIQDRVNQTAFDLLIAQTYGSFIIRGIAGIEQPIDPVTGKPVEIELAINRLLTSGNPDMKGWQFDPTPLDPYLNSLKEAKNDFAMAGRVAPHHLQTNMVNLAADAISAAETGEQQKKLAYQHAFGEQAEQHLELAAAVAGVAPLGGDSEAEAKWADIGSRSLSQAADALGKLSEQMGIPPRALWSRIPGWTKADTDYALQLLKEQQDQDPVNRMIDRLDEDDQDANVNRFPNVA